MAWRPCTGHAEATKSGALHFPSIFYQLLSETISTLSQHSQFCRHTEVVRVLLDANTDPLLPVRGWFKNFLLGSTCAGMTNNEHTTELLETYEAGARRRLHSEV
jgi:hypothetical protein